MLNFLSANGLVVISFCLNLINDCINSIWLNLMGQPHYTALSNEDDYRQLFILTNRSANQSHQRQLTGT